MQFSHLYTVFIVNGESMSPTLNDKDVVVLKNQEHPTRDSLVIFEKTVNNTQKKMIKRVIGLPHDTLSVENNTLKLNGIKINTTCSHPNLHESIPEGTLLVKGDNQDNSHDSISILCQGEDDYLILSDNVVTYGKIEKVLKWVN